MQKEEKVVSSPSLKEPKAIRVIEYLQKINKKLRRQVKEITLTEAKKIQKKAVIEIFQNGEQRAEILFSQYPDLEKAYSLNNGLRKIYNQKIIKSVAMLKLAHWFKEESGFKSFSIVLKIFMYHYNDILNYFDQRSTNVSAESFNAKIKNFRLQLRGVKDKTFFLFRLSKIFAQSPSFVLIRFIER